MFRSSSRVLFVVVALVSSLLAAAPVGAQTGFEGGPADAVVNGVSVTDPTAYPFMVQLEHADGTHECSGTLIRPNKVMTARHCIMMLNGTEMPGLANWVIRYGTTGQFGGNTVGFTGYTHLPGSNVDRIRDAVILHLDANVTLDANVGLVQLATDAEIASASQTLLLGWGKTSDSAPPAATLQQTTIVVESDSYCNSVWGSAYYPDRHFCGGGITSDICHGDSGGPLMIVGADGRLKQAAITAEVFNNMCLDGTPSKFLDVRFFRQMIINAAGPLFCGGAAATVDFGLGEIPTVGNDRIVGTPYNDIINSGDGDDTVCAAGGDDIVTLGSGDDVMWSGPGNDSVQGDAGNDRIFGLDGDDQLFGGFGDDRLYGGSGNDVVAGLEDNDKLWGGTGNDTISGGFGDDEIYAMDGDDMAWGESGSDVLFGGPGNDTLNGGSENDVIHGLDGNDAIIGDGGDDQLYAGTGDDNVDGGAGDDLIYGGLGADQLFGSFGNDNIYAAAGTDQVWGGPDDDSLWGGPDNDVVNGDAGTDVCDGIGGFDTTDGSCETLIAIP